MPRTFTTQDITDVDIEQIVITKSLSKDADGKLVIRVKSNVTVTLKDSTDPARTTAMSLNVNKTIQELNIVGPINAISIAVLNSFKSQLT